jgi:hypothetical protein
MAIVCQNKQYLPKPICTMDYPEDLWILLTKCFAYEPRNRPTFENILEELFNIQQKLINNNYVM